MEIKEELELPDEESEVIEAGAPETEEEPLSNEDYLKALLTTARSAARPLSVLTAAAKNQALLSMAEGLEEATDAILEANEEDLTNFGDDPSRTAMADRLKLTPERVAGMATQIREIAALRDPVGESLGIWQRPNGMKVGKVRVPIGVIGIIYESRPNVTADAAALCLKSGNVCVLRGGSEAIHSNTAIAKILGEAASKSGIPEGAITFIDRPDREVVIGLLKSDQYVDLIIPRGGESLMATVTSNSTIPVVKHDKGVCHIYVDADADLEQAQKIAFNAKVQRPSTCNTMECLLVNEKVAKTFLVPLGKQLREAGVEIRGCPKTCGIVPEAKPAQDDDYGKEFLSLILAVKVVKDMEQAMEHIETYGSRHTESILTNNYNRALRFLRQVDASAVMINASTRLNDGYEFGLGAEMGISTTRLHARGPMGLEDLTCSKYVVYGSGQIRE
ncbi:MAG: glutamate-5-semialdehyde dehydrogenase [Nitrospirales bacterium]|nr:glutamate-5-semialdehyde dehydrogenase [Nitrospira sp.]MDR4502721.1 glutamate-5-semialdehyde dehydrogenase [Nitrospirales bacterium]